MKKLFSLLFISGILIFSSCESDQSEVTNNQLEFDNKDVSIKEACDIANVFNSLHYGTLSESRSAQVQSVQTIKGINDKVIAYIVNREEGGWVIVSATKDFHPILAYSDSLTGKLDLTPDYVNSGLSVWVDEIAEAIEESNSFDEQTVKEIAAEWKGFEVQLSPLGDPGLPVGNSPEAIKCRERLKQLNETYTKDGWSFRVLTNISGVVLPDEVYSTADWLGSPYEYTIVGIRDVTNYTNIGPILTTRWNKNSFIHNGSPVGSAPIAIAQIMYYYMFPVQYNWDYMDRYEPTIVSTEFVSGLNIYMGQSDKYSVIDIAYETFKSRNYNVVKKDHYNQDVVRQLVLRKPVFMCGNDGNLSHVLGYDDYAWVCDGVIQNIPEYEYYVEYLNSAKEYTNYGMTLLENPGRTGNLGYINFHMNWGCGGNYDGWYTVAKPNGNDFSHGRKNLYVTPNR